MRAWSMLEIEPVYRSRTFLRGLEAAGFETTLGEPPLSAGGPGDVLVTWNLGPRHYDAATRFRERGGHVIVAEKGYFDPDRYNEPVYALARDGHNGSGFWFVGDESRFEKWGLNIHPWRGSTGDRVVVAGQRGVGSPEMRPPRNFTERIVPDIHHALARGGVRDCTVVIRPYSDRESARVSLWDDLRDARALVTWSSDVANIAVLWGVPAFRMAPHHVNDAVEHGLEKLTDPPEPDREAALERLSWAQWSTPEIESGDAVRFLLQDAVA